MLSIFIIGVIWFINFWSCETVSWLKNYIYSWTVDFWEMPMNSYTNPIKVITVENVGSSLKNYCIEFDIVSWSVSKDYHFTIWFGKNSYWSSWWITKNWGTNPFPNVFNVFAEIWQDMWTSWTVCLFWNVPYLNIWLLNWMSAQYSWRFILDYKVYDLTSLLNTELSSSSYSLYTTFYYNWVRTNGWFWDNLVDNKSYVDIYLSWNKSFDGVSVTRNFNNSPDYTLYKFTADLSCPDCSICDDPYTSLECQNEYNLIPVENVTKEYCEINHNLISPESCPICEWSGSINWSALYINNEQVSSASRINVNIDDWIDYNLNYVEDSATINVTGPEWDQEYIQWIIDTNSYQPSTEDFKNVFVWWLTLILPYLVVVLFVVFIWKFIRKIFK